MGSGKGVAGMSDAMLVENEVGEEMGSVTCGVALVTVDEETVGFILVVKEADFV